MKKAMLLTAALALGSFSAHAGVIPTNTAVSGSGSSYTWSYDASMALGLEAISGVPAATATMSAAAFFTIYVFVGFIPGSCASRAGWGCSTQDLGLTPSGLV